MKRVLIWKKVSAGSEYDVFRGMDSLEEYNWRETFNVGNRLWFQGLLSAIDTKENQYAFLTDTLTADEINHEFDFIILPMANIFNTKFRHYLDGETFARIKIPVYVIACGAQADNYESLDLLVNDIGDLSKRFIESIYHTGGEFALRGYFTKEFFSRLGFSSAVVTGCPSMFQMGSKFSAEGGIPNTKPQKPVFNGNVLAMKALMDAYPESVFMDQDTFWRELYSQRNGQVSLREELAFYCNYDPYYAKLLGENRVRLIPDMYNWSRYLQETKVDYSFGSRIHGSIMAILSGIPATLVAVDTRTEEMADFFNIPYVRHIAGHQYSTDELHDLYERTDYSKFNQTYGEKYRAYEDFLVKHGIVSQINQSNPFFSKCKEYVAPPEAMNISYYKKMTQKIRRDKLLLDCGKLLVSLRK